LDTSLLGQFLSSDWRSERYQPAGMCESTDRRNFPAALGDRKRSPDRAAAKSVRIHPFEFIVFALAEPRATASTFP
jgi:hypothetical protein